MLAHTAGRFPTLRSGTLVTGQSYRNPALTAKIASTIQFLTGGRFVLGLGAGWKEDEYRAYGYPYPPALMVGGGGEQRTMRVVAEHADWWNADYYTASDYGRKLERLRGYCREIGRDHDSVLPTYYAGISVAHDPSKVVRRPPISYRPDEMFVLHGNPDEVSAQIEEFAALGVQHMQLNFLDFPRTEGLDLFFSEVLSRFR